MSSFLSQLRWELFRLYARKRTYIGFGIFLAVEVLIHLILTRERSREGMEEFFERVAGGFDEFYSALTLAFLIVSVTLFLLGLVSVALVAGDMVAKESEDGNLRLLLARPVSRFRLLAVKFLACQIFALSLFVFVGITALAVGWLERGWGGSMLVWSPDLPRVSLFPSGEGLLRYWVAIPAFVLVYLPVTGVAFYFSCLKIKPAAATILTVAIFLGDFVLASIPLPAFDPYREFFLTSRMKSWLLLFHEDIPWAELAGQWTWLVATGLSAFTLGWVAFERRDVKS